VRIDLSAADVEDLREGARINVLVDGGLEVWLSGEDLSSAELDQITAGEAIEIYLPNLSATCYSSELGAPPAAPRQPTRAPPPGTRFYVVAVEGGITPFVAGPFDAAEARDDEAKRIHGAQDPDTDATFWADVEPDGRLVLEPYSGGFLDDLAS
jgi:hypothetical protein